MAKLETSPWHHWGEGRYVARVKGTGDVALRRTREGETKEIIIVSKAEWVLIVAFVSRRGSSKPQLKRAMELHG